MNLQQLEYVIAVDRFKNFSRAAAHCFVTQATLSAMVKKLEIELEVTIFDRKKSPVITTDCGTDIIEEAKKALYHINLIQDYSKTVQDTIDGRIRVGIIPTIANTLLPIILKPLLLKFPDLIIEVHEITTDNLLKDLETGSLDFGILATPVEYEQIEENILYYESMMVYGVHDLKSQYILPEQLNDSKIWLLEEGHCFRNQAINICNLDKKEDLPDNLIFEANSFETLLNITDEFGGITLIPELFYQSMSLGRKKRTQTFQVPLPVREVSLVYYRPYAKLRIINRLTEEIKELMKGKLVSEKYRARDLSIIGI
ncbi:MAG: LysR substrate-binding domain-containing protein [Bacteroidota bacterium]|nr:LysR substrate-binding domain-containing protein [Bacteroidota bacterium]